MHRRHVLVALVVLATCPACGDIRELAWPGAFASFALAPVVLPLALVAGDGSAPSASSGSCSSP